MTALNACIHLSTTRYFADDTNLLYIIDDLKTRNCNPTRKLNMDLKSLNPWLIANKISLNATKTELIYFRDNRTAIPLEETTHVKYVGIIFDEHLTIQKHINYLMRDSKGQIIY